MLIKEKNNHIDSSPNFVAEQNTKKTEVFIKPVVNNKIQSQKSTYYAVVSEKGSIVAILETMNMAIYFCTCKEYLYHLAA